MSGSPVGSGCPLTRCTFPMAGTGHLNGCRCCSADHPDPAAVVECTLPDGSQGWVPASVAALVEAMPPENAARLRRLLGELLPALWAEGMWRRVDGTVGPLDSFARAAPPDVAARWAARSRR